MCLVIPLKVNERVGINFNKCWLIAVWLVFWRTKASHSIWQLFLSHCEDARSRWHCGPVDNSRQGWDRTRGKSSTDSQSPVQKQSSLHQLGPAQWQNERLKENFKKSLRLQWIHNMGIDWAFCNFIQSSFIEFLTGLEPHLWIAWLLLPKISNNGLPCVCAHVCLYVWCVFKCVCVDCVCGM